MQSTFLPEYLRRKEEETEEFPGYIGDFASQDSARAGLKLPSSMHLLDPHVLKREFESAGFQVEQVGFIARTDDFPEILKLNGKESCGIIAVKHK